MRVTSKIDVICGGEVSNGLITALPRVSTNHDASYVLHLINRRFDPETNEAVRHHIVHIRIAPSLYSNPITGAKLHAPGQTPRDSSLEQDDRGNVLLEIGHFDLWNLIELTH